MAFIVFEGIDGAGKSTLIRGLSEQLKRQQISHHITREPGGTKLGDELREIILRKSEEPPCPTTELLLYMAIRAQHVEKTIMPSLAKKHWVLCDRFTYSSLAFQAGGRNLPPDPITWLNQFSTKGVSPDLWVLLDIEPIASLQRIHQRASEGQDLDRFESEQVDFHRRVRDYYLKIAQNDKNCLILKSEMDKESLLKQLLQELQKRGLILNK